MYSRYNKNKELEMYYVINYGANSELDLDNLTNFWT